MADMDLDSQPSLEATSVASSTPSPHLIADEELPATQSQDYADQAKYDSTPPPPSSMTTPPSSQLPPRVSSKIDHTMENRTVTPRPSTYSSPPPTENSQRRNGTSSSAYAKPSQSFIAQSSRSELEALLGTAMTEIERLHLEVREARMSAAHFKLQHNLLSIDTEETFKRMEVEHEMTRREVEVLQMSEQYRQARAEPEADHVYVANLKNYCTGLSDDLETTCRRLQKAKKLMKKKDEEISCLNDENTRLKKRIRENREHLSQLRSPGGIFAATTPRTFPSTPQQYRGTPKHTPGTNGSRAHAGSQEPFAQLLLADRVLSQENASNSAPSTPILSRTPVKRHQAGHTRAAHSLSSLPTTPVRSSYAPSSDNALLPAVQFVAQSEPRYRTSAHGSFSRHQPASERHRKSRDSTISASDGEDGYVSDRAGDGSDEEVEESQASQSATAMLRKDPRESFEVVGTPSLANTPTSEVGVKSNLLQRKIFGTVTKPGVEKRKRNSDAGSGSHQKARKLGEGVGLGIGGWESPQM